MNRTGLILGIVFGLMVCLTAPAQFAHASVEWRTLKDLDLKAQPLDVTQTAEGDFIFILTPGEIIVYSISKEEPINRIPVDKAYDRLTLSSRENMLLLTSKKRKALKIIQLDFVKNIEISGLPVKGPKDAPVILAVFSDYQ
jgi:hypothetical protein